MEKTQHIVILAAGGFPCRRELISMLADADIVVCCDSAYEGILAHRDFFASIPNFVVIGDGDSLSADAKRELGDRWIQVDEQDYNDLHKAMQYAINNYCLSQQAFEIPPYGGKQHYGVEKTHFSILGATGRREDHTIGNISYLVTFAEEYPDADIEMFTDYGRFTAMKGVRNYASFPRQQVSIFSMEPDKPIYGKGLKWSLDGFHARRWWQATLNEALADSFQLCSEGWLIVFQTYEPK